MDLQIQIVATGSRMMGQRQVGSGLLGRGMIMRIFPLTIAEIVEAHGRDLSDFSLPHGIVDSPWLNEQIALYRIYGGYPKVVFAPTLAEKKDALIQITERIFTTDLPLLLGADMIIDARKIFQYLALNIGNKAKIEGFATLFQIPAKRVRAIIDFFIESYLVYALFPYYSDKSREYSDRPKLYLHDLGMLAAVRHSYGEPLPDGKITENLLVHEISAVADEGDVLAFYQKINGSEIDFIISSVREGKLCIVEAKSGNKTIIPRIFHSFVERYPSTTHGYVSTESLFATGDARYSHIPYWYIGSVI
jgi:predicted AAA+ superfamily ATPase